MTYTCFLHELHCFRLMRISSFLIQRNFPTKWLVLSPTPYFTGSSVNLLGVIFHILQRNYCSVLLSQASVRTAFIVNYFTTNSPNDNSLQWIYCSFISKQSKTESEPVISRYSHVLVLMFKLCSLITKKSRRWRSGLERRPCKRKVGYSNPEAATYVSHKNSYRQLHC